jgi:phosphoserine phosphatase
MSGIRAAHLLADLAPHLQRLAEQMQVQPELAPDIRRIADMHAARLFALLKTDVFTHRVQFHSQHDGEQFDPAAHTDALAIVPQHHLTFLAQQEQPIQQRTQDVLRLHGRLDAGEITASVAAIEQQFIADCEVVLGRLHVPHTDPEHGTLPQKTVVASDMDGVLAVLRMQNPEHKGPVQFRDTRLGSAVQRNAEAFEEEVRARAGGLAAPNDHDTERGLLPYFVQKYGSVMEEGWGEESQQRIRQIFLESYPASRREEALQAAEQHIAGMPLAYHVFRHKTWDHNVADVYDMDQQAADFAIQVIERGGTLLFVTAAPRIHALKMLKASGVMDAVGPEGFELYTMEDMYEPGTVENRTFAEGDKGTLLANWAQQRGIPKDQIAMGGDQYHSDVAPVVAQGIQSRVVSGPAGLNRYLASIRLPRDEASGAQE